MGTGLDHPVSGLLRGLAGKNVTVNTKFDVTVNLNGLFRKYMYHKLLKSIINR